MPEPGVEETYVRVEEHENAYLAFVRQPRILLILLAAWAIIAFLTQLFLNSTLFTEAESGDEVQIDGLLAGLAMNWESLALAVLYLYCARDPERHPAVFWLALVALCASMASSLYHWLVTGTYTIESVLVPLIVSGGLTALVFLHLFGRKDEAPAAPGTQ
jgi:hypothetical protein